MLLERRTRRGWEPHVLETKYNAIMPVDTANLQAEGVTCLLRSLSIDEDDVVQMRSELQVYDATSQFNILDHWNRRYTVTVYYRLYRLY